MDAMDKLPIPLLEWFRDNARRLPWRDDPTPYHIWLSEVMLQQTRVAAVLEYYRRFLEEAPDVEALAALPEERLMKLWQGLGYYSRARNLQKAARVIMDEHGGVFPRGYAAVRALPGVGDYTAGAICSIAFGQATPAVDGNVLRVYARLMGDNGDISTPQMKKKADQAVGRVIPAEAPGAFNQALMELGATVCLPNGAPLCRRCPAKGFCAALAQDRVDKLPVRAAKKPRRVEERTVWLIFYGGRVALRRRAEHPGGVGDRSRTRGVCGAGQAHFYPCRVAYVPADGESGVGRPAARLDMGGQGRTGGDLRCAGGFRRGASAGKRENGRDGITWQNCISATA